MTALVLRLAAPLQSWGTSSRFVRRGTGRAPSRSGVIGMLAAAQGLRRTDSLQQLLGLRIWVRTEQNGRVERDFQTARSRDGSEVMPLSYRYYLADAVFAVAVEGPVEVLDGLREALRRPVFPVYLGRRSCPPAGRLDHGLHDGDVESVLETLPWLASPAVRRAAGPTAELTVHRDCDPGTPGSELVHDVPVSFDPAHRQWGWRSVIRYPVTVPNPAAEPVADPHDPMDLLGDAV
ncbi:type I-E CRISPR-associated protein Cas5/CasD [Actinophytocola xinjiangensis]|uniref:Type I-E CRISPR-associated protein Cas5/CasD n=1 Tax=Actinophytocola xinjiangensis TaxID=485602 RepID=A0A7Z0WKN6_9PSEU|nr:type I-E CRISPR-associated protein Cas5/CasD [Actinophytocola xinjiangensis]OLF09063.1 type I-E CRISPR-associated protein Cas5/CasD [Actinophytocola xinjiangensis]